MDPGFSRHFRADYLVLPSFYGLKFEHDLHRLEMRWKKKESTEFEFRFISFLFFLCVWKPSPMAVFLLFLCWIFDESTVSAGVAAPTHRRCVSSFFLFFLFFLFFPLPTSFRLLAASCGQKKSIDGVARSLILFLYHFFSYYFIFNPAPHSAPLDGRPFSFFFYL